MNHECSVVVTIYMVSYMVSLSIHLRNPLIIRWITRLITRHDVIMTTIACQITSLTVVYSTVYSDADQRKHQSSASLAFVWGIHRDRWIPRTKGQLRGKGFHLMTSSCFLWAYKYFSILSRHKRALESDCVKWHFATLIFHMLFGLLHVLHHDR